MLCCHLLRHAGESDFILNAALDLKLSYRREGPDYDF